MVAASSTRMARSRSTVIAKRKDSSFTRGSAPVSAAVIESKMRPKAFRGPSARGHGWRVRIEHPQAASRQTAVGDCAGVVRRTLLIRERCLPALQVTGGYPKRALRGIPTLHVPPPASSWVYAVTPLLGDVRSKDKTSSIPAGCLCE